jgi:hypothetical protein
MPIPPTSPASLDGTLNGMDAQSQADALAQALQQHLAEQTAQAAQQANQAGQQYQQAASAPPPDLSPLAALIPQLGGNFASVIGRNPEYARQANEDIKGQRSALLKARADNLQALQDTYAQKAQAAKAAGDFEAEQNALVKREQINKTLAGILEQQHHANALDEINARAEAQKRVNAAKPTKAAAPPGDFSSQVNTTGSGKQFLDLTNVGVKEMADARNWAKANGVPAVSKNGADHLRRIQTARDNIDTMLAQAESILPGTPEERAAKYGNRKMSQILQTNEARAAWNTWRISAIQQLTALAGGMGSGLRINQAEIQQAIANDIPTLNDTYAVALRKANNIRTMLDHTEGPIINTDWRKQGATPAQAPVAADETKGVLLESPDGKSRRYVKSTDVPGLIKQGARRVSP